MEIIRSLERLWISPPGLSKSTSSTDIGSVSGQWGEGRRARGLSNHSGPLQVGVPRQVGLQQAEPLGTQGWQRRMTRALGEPLPAKVSPPGKPQHLVPLSFEEGGERTLIPVIVNIRSPAHSEAGPGVATAESLLICCLERGTQTIGQKQRARKRRKDT